MNYKGYKPSIFDRLWMGFKYGTCTVVILFLSFVACMATYHELTDIEYTVPYSVTELGQCLGDGSRATCKARVKGFVITTDEPMMLGQIMYRKCWIQKNGSNLCSGWDDEPGIGLSEAMRQHKERL